MRRGEDDVGRDEAPAMSRDLAALGEEPDRVRLGDENGLTLLGSHSQTAVIVFSAFDYPQ